MLSLVVVLVIAVVLDRVLGEPRRGHPLVIFGRWADHLERKFNHGGAEQQRVRGLAALAIAVLPWVGVAAIVSSLEGVGIVVEVLLLYLALGAASLKEHALNVADPLAKGDLDAARERVSYIVSRDTSAMDEGAVCRATVESVLENGNDAVFGALFWFVVAGAPGVVLYRLVNTLDAMWGYRNDRFRHFGTAAARLDDLLNWIPARLTALTYALVGDYRRGRLCWLMQGRCWESPNAGPVMAAGAGSLGVLLGGNAVYHGHEKMRPRLGLGCAPQSVDIERAWHLVARGQWLWVLVLILIALLVGGDSFA